MQQTSATANRDRATNRRSTPIESNLAGHVTTWTSRGYGFIARDDGGPDVFVHVRECPGEQPLRVGLAVRFDIGADSVSARSKAVNVRVVSGQHNGVAIA